MQDLLKNRMNPLKTFQKTAFRLIILAVLPAGVGAWFLSPIFAKGFMLGVAAGCFWLAIKFALARNFTRGARYSAMLFSLGGPFSMVIYAAALYAAYFLDTDKFRGCFGVIAGLLLVQAVIILIGITGWDLHGNKSFETRSPESPSEMGS
jgi:hypothetical protein